MSKKSWIFSGVFPHTYNIIFFPSNLKFQTSHTLSVCQHLGVCSQYWTLVFLYYNFSYSMFWRGITQKTVFATCCGAETFGKHNIRRANTISGTSKCVSKDKEMCRNVIFDICKHFGSKTCEFHVKYKCIYQIAIFHRPFACTVTITPSISTLTLSTFSIAFSSLAWSLDLP